MDGGKKNLLICRRTTADPVQARKCQPVTRGWQFPEEGLIINSSFARWSQPC
jgi:hypothetical protein